MDAKQTLIEAFANDLPDGIKDFLETEIPELQATPGPYDAENPTQNSEILAHNLNTILKTYEGMTPAAIPLYIGQLNTVNQGLLLSALEYLGATGDIKVIAPTDGSRYYGHFGITTLYEVDVLRGTVQQISVDLGVEGEEFEMEEDPETPGRWLAEWPTAIGDYTATFTAWYDDNSTSTKTVTFSVATYPTYPEEGDELPTEQDATWTLDPKGDDVQSVDVTITNDDTEESVNVTLERVEDIFEQVIDWATIQTIAGGTAAFYTAVFKISLMVREYEKQIKFKYIDASGQLPGA